MAGGVKYVFLLIKSNTATILTRCTVKKDEIKVELLRRCANRGGYFDIFFVIIMDILLR